MIDIIVKDESFKLKLLYNIPIQLSNGLYVYPLTSCDIAKIGYNNYQCYLSYLIAEPSDYFQDSEVDLTNVTTFDIIMVNVLQNESECKDMIKGALKLFLKEDINIVESHEVIIIGDINNVDKCICLDSNMLEEIKKILKLQNCIVDRQKEKTPVFANDRQRDVYEKLKKGRERNLSENSVSISSIINAVIHGGKSFISYDDVSRMSIFQLYNTYEAMFKVENYYQNFKMLLAGASSENVDLKHWSQTLKIE